MNLIKIEKVVVDMKTGERKEYEATVASQPDSDHSIYTLTYEGYQSPWVEVKP